MNDAWADTVWLNGRILTLDPSHNIATAVAARDGKVVAVGHSHDVQPLIRAETRVINLDGRFMMPGLIDTHVHAIWGGIRDLFEVYVGYQASLEEIGEAIAAKARTVPEGTWIEGGPWRPDHMQSLGETSPREFLDRFAPGHPVLFSDTTQHNVWVNSLALAHAGLHKDSQVPDGGRVELDDKTGEPNGLLIEGASGPVRAKVTRSDAALKEAAVYAASKMHAMGITAIKEPMANESDLRAYCYSDECQALNLHVFCHIARRTPIRAEVYSLDKMNELRLTYRSENVCSDGAKLFLDGVAPSRTAAFLDPYVPASPCGCDVGHHDPEACLLRAPDELGDEVAELDRAGFLVKMHAVGDRAVRAGLDAIEIARSRNGQTGLRHEIAHTTFVSEQDKPRFRSLNAIAEVSPKLWFPNPITAGQIAVLGEERTQRCHPIATLAGAGAEITYGSDWPAAAPDASPWPGLSGMLTRRDASATYAGTVGRDEGIDLTKALEILVSNGARALNRQNTIGRIAAGYWADMIVLDRDITAIDAQEIATTVVEQTYFRGTRVH